MRSGAAAAGNGSDVAGGLADDATSVLAAGGSGPSFEPPRKLGVDHHVVQVACTEQLYRIFERC
jgi:hypothetical protein